MQKKTRETVPKVMLATMEMIQVRKSTVNLAMITWTLMKNTPQ